MRLWGRLSPNSFVTLCNSFKIWSRSLFLGDLTQLLHILPILQRFWGCIGKSLTLSFKLWNNEDNALPLTWWVASHTSKGLFWTPYWTFSAWMATRASSLKNIQSTQLETLLWIIIVLLVISFPGERRTRERGLGTYKHAVQLKGCYNYLEFRICTSVQ